MNRGPRNVTCTGVTNQAVYELREHTGTSGVLLSAQTAAATLAAHDIPHLIVGGVAVQEHGYPRVRVDLELTLLRKLPRDPPVAQAIHPLYLET